MAEGIDALIHARRSAVTAAECGVGTPSRCGAEWQQQQQEEEKD